jgi:hypothetical protein
LKHAWAQVPKAAAISLAVCAVTAIFPLMTPLTNWTGLPMILADCDGVHPAQQVRPKDTRLAENFGGLKWGN